MDERKTISLKIVAVPGAGPVVSAPPVLDSGAGAGTVDYTCGQCGTVLLRAQVGQIHNLTIRCTSCGAHNSTDA